jgi:hypothetical protein
MDHAQVAFDRPSSLGLFGKFERRFVSSWYGSRQLRRLIAVPVASPRLRCKLASQRQVLKREPGAPKIVTCSEVSRPGCLAAGAPGEEHRVEQ